MAFPDNYTPVPDILVKVYGFTTAYVWGAIWRYCQMQGGSCNAAHETIAERAGISTRSLRSHLKRLIQDGYIEDLTPDRTNKPHDYNVTKGEELIKSTLQNLHTEQSQAAKFAEQDEPTLQNLPSNDTYTAKFAEPTLQNLQPKRVFKETITTNVVGGQPQNETPNGVSQRLAEPEQGPRWQLMNEFIHRSGIPLPTRKPDQKYWWNQIGNIYEISLRDVDVGKKLIRDALEKLRGENLTISDPGSLVKTTRALMAQSKQKVRISPI